MKTPTELDISKYGRQNILSNSNSLDVDFGKECEITTKKQNND